jgi:hypothetical protein
MLGYSLIFGAAAQVSNKFGPSAASDVIMTRARIADRTNIIEIGGVLGLGIKGHLRLAETRQYITARILYSYIEALN